MYTFTINFSRSYSHFQESRLTNIFEAIDASVADSPQFMYFKNDEVPATISMIVISMLENNCGYTRYMDITLTYLQLFYNVSSIENFDSKLSINV